MLFVLIGCALMWKLFILGHPVYALIAGLFWAFMGWLEFRR